MRGIITKFVRRLRCFAAKKRNPEWLDQPDGKFDVLHNYETWCKELGRQGKSDVSPERYREELIGKLKVRPGPLVQISRLNDGMNLLFQDADEFALSIDQQREPLVLLDKKIRWLRVSFGASIELSRCLVKELRIDNGVKELRIQNCEILKLSLENNICRIDITDSVIRSVAVTGSNPGLIGPVTFQNVTLPTDQSEIQSLRTLRAALTRIHNTVPAGIVHAAELRLERERQGLLEESLSWLYDLASVYGTSIVRPLEYFISFVFLNIGVLYATDATRVVPRELIGWQSVLEYDQYAPFYRAAALTVGQVLNPLGTFGGAPLIVITKPWIAGVSTVNCALATFTLALFILAVRRRFRLEM
jgi:hypothetical protein